MRPIFCDSFMTVPRRTDPLITSNLRIDIVSSPKFAKPLLQFSARIFIRVESQNPIVSGLTDCEGNVRLLRKRPRSLNEPSAERLHQTANVFEIRSVVNDDEFVVTVTTLVQQST